VTLRQKSDSNVIPEEPAPEGRNRGSGIQFVEIGDGKLEYLDLPATRHGLPALLLLHEGLGSVSMWRDFPAQLARSGGLAQRIAHRQRSPHFDRPYGGQEPLDPLRRAGE